MHGNSKLLANVVRCFCIRGGRIKGESRKGNLMDYKCALLGCGGRAVGIIKAYRHIKRGKMVAICDRHEDKLSSIGDQFGISARYSDLEEMLGKEKPDVLHLVTQPTHRLDVFTIAGEAGVPAIIVEKPIGNGGEDYLELRKFQTTTSTKICINHQLHFHPRQLNLQEYVRDGNIGEVRMIDASARMNLSFQGTHALELISAFNAGAKPMTVFGQVAGTDGLEGRNGHYAPDQCSAVIAYENGIRAQFQCGTNAPSVKEGTVNTHKRIAVYGTGGFIYWTMNGWERTGPNGSLEQGDHNYADEDILGQAGLTEAMFDWLEDDAKIHPTNLDASLTQFNVVLAIYMSALNHTPITLPVKPEPKLIEKLEKLP